MSLFESTFSERLVDVVFCVAPQEEIKDAYFKIAFTRNMFESQDTLPANFSDNETAPPFLIPLKREKSKRKCHRVSKPWLALSVC